MPCTQCAPVRANRHSRCFMHEYSLVSMAFVLWGCDLSGYYHSNTSVAQGVLPAACHYAALACLLGTQVKVQDVLKDSTTEPFNAMRVEPICTSLGGAPHSHSHCQLQPQRNSLTIMHAASTSPHAPAGRRISLSVDGYVKRSTFTQDTHSAASGASHAAHVQTAPGSSPASLAMQSHLFKHGSTALIMENTTQQDLDCLDSDLRVFARGSETCLYVVPNSCSSAATSAHTGAAASSTRSPHPEATLTTAFRAAPQAGPRAAMPAPAPSSAPAPDPRAIPGAASQSRSTLPLLTSPLPQAHAQMHAGGLHGHVARSLLVQNARPSYSPVPGTSATASVATATAAAMQRSASPMLPIIPSPQHAQQLHHAINAPSPSPSMHTAANTHSMAGKACPSVGGAGNGNGNFATRFIQRAVASGTQLLGLRMRGRNIPSPMPQQTSPSVLQVTSRAASRSTLLPVQTHGSLHPGQTDGRISPFPCSNPHPHSRPHALAPYVADAFSLSGASSGSAPSASSPGSSRGAHWAASSSQLNTYPGHAVTSAGTASGGMTKACNVLSTGAAAATIAAGGGGGAAAIVPNGVLADGRCSGTGVLPSRSASVKAQRQLHHNTSSIE